MQADADRLVQWASWAGQHALPLYFGVLAMLLLAACSVGWSRRRFTGPDALGGLAMPSSTGVRIALGGSVALAAAALFFALATSLGASPALNRADLALTGALRAPAWALSAFGLLTHLGDTLTLTGLCTLVALALVAGGARGLAFGWVVAVAGNGALNQGLKEVFARVRPLDAQGAVLEQGFSFPSGHSSGSVVAYGMLAYLALRLLPARWHLPALAVAVALAFTVGASRVFLRVHFASDVLAGFASGAAWLALCVTGIERMRWRRRPPA